MDYSDLGYDQFLNKSLPSFADPMSSEDTGSLLMPQISGSSLASGKSLSNDGKLIINWDTGEVIFSDGARGRVFLGKIEGSDSYGIKIVDAEGNIVMTTTGEIQTEGLADSAVTTVKINALAVTTAKIKDANITTAKINDLAVEEGKIKNLAVTNAKITSMSADKITTGTLSVITNVGSTAVKIDGSSTNKGLYVYSGATPVIFLGIEVT